MKTLSATSLKQELWATMQEIRQGSVAPENANAVAAQAREILRTVRTQVIIAEKAKRDLPHELIEFAGK